MGMFDYVVCYDGQFKDAEGNELSSFQTKSLSDTMATYMIIGRQFVKLGKSYRKSVSPKWIVTAQKVEPTTENATVIIYTSADSIKPVLTKGQWDWKRIQEHHPWVEFAVSVDNGVVEKVRVVKNQTRAQLRKELSKTMQILPDSSLAAKAYFEQIADRKKKPKDQVEDD